MNIQLEQARARANFLRYQPNSKKGHYESYFIRANHPTKAQAFWIRYTLFIPKGLPDNGIAEMWSIFFDEEHIYSNKTEFELQDCQLAQDGFNIRIKDNHLRYHQAIGQLEDWSWDLQLKTEQKPIFLLPLLWYDLPFPKAKSIVSQPFARFNGHIMVGKDQKKFIIDDWVGSQNHNWGTEHTDEYAWGQVIGFDNAPDSMLEIISAKLKVAQQKTPPLTLMVIQHRGKTYKFNQLLKSWKARSQFGYFYWNFNLSTKDVEISGRIEAKAEQFVGLTYYNPSGGNKYCLNTKIAACQLLIKDTKTGHTDLIETKHRCAFELLTDDEHTHGISIHH